MLFVSGNASKTEQIRTMLNLSDLNVQSVAVDLPEIQSLDLARVSRTKLEAALRNEEVSRAKSDYVLVDDTGLSLQTLRGLPGPMIKWFVQRIGARGIFEMMNGRNSRATAQCVLSLWTRRSDERSAFTGTIRGSIVKPRPETGFGWDPVFQMEGKNQTLAELTLAEKSTLTHRGQAVAQLRKFLTTTAK